MRAKNAIKIEIISPHFLQKGGKELKQNAKESNINLYYMNDGQESKETIEDMMKRKKEREKRIKQNRENQQKQEFDIETEEVIQMTNKNRLKQEKRKKEQLSKKERKRIKRNKKIKRIVKAFILIAIIIGGTIFAMVSPIFNIKDIQVLNNEQLSSETIVSLSQLQIGQNIFRFKSSLVIDSVKENPYIEKVSIHRKIPNTIKIEVEERKAEYSVDFMGKFAYINNQGYILEISEDSKKMPIIRGISTTEENVTEGNRLSKEDLNKLVDVIKIMNAAKEVELDAKVTSIDISNKSEYIIEIEEEQKKIHLGDTTNLSNKMLYAIGIMEKEKGIAGEVFVNGDLNNKFRTYFREKV